MEEIYVNVKPSPNKGPRSSERRFHGAVVLCLGLLSVFLLGGLIGLAVHYHNSVQCLAAEVSAVKNNLAELLQASYDKILFLNEDRDLLRTNSKHMENNLTELRAQLTRMTEKSDWQKSCSAGWRMFRCAFYFLSTVSDSWEKGRQDCRNRGADLVVIDSADEQMFLSNFTKKGTHAWIGLTDKEEEGTWKWLNGAPLTDKFWRPPQPDNGGAPLGEEDCAHIIITGNDFNNWNDLACDTRLRWICEKGLDAES